jgi:ESCRT-II complex subunit VPS25
MTTTLSPTSPPASTYTFPPHYSFPPFFTRQPNPVTRSAQYASWSAHILSYSRHHHLWTLSLFDALPTPLFTNSTLNRSLSLPDAQDILSWMASPEGGERIEWLAAGKGGGRSKDRCFVFWRKPDEWAREVEAWVADTGQNGSVLTVYEIAHGEASRGQEWWGMERELLVQSVMCSVKRGKAVVLGEGEEMGVKYF